MAVMEACTGGGAAAFDPRRLGQAVVSRMMYSWSLATATPSWFACPACKHSLNAGNFPCHLPCSPPRACD